MNNELNTEGFFSKIEKSSSLRLKLINDLNTIANNDSLDYSCRFHYIRSNIPSLYSQYEGFLKDIFYNIPLFLMSLDKSEKLNNSFLSIYISSRLFYMKESNYLKYSSSIDSLIKSFFNSDTKYFEGYTFGKIEIPHDGNMPSFLELFNFSDDSISQFNVYSPKIKTYYNRRNSIIHGSIDECDSNGFHLSEHFNESHFKRVLSLWNEQYKFTKQIIAILKDETFKWVQDELYKC